MNKLSNQQIKLDERNHVEESLLDQLKRRVARGCSALQKVFGCCVAGSQCYRPTRPHSAS
jgi:hypothetical protein